MHQPAMDSGTLLSRLMDVRRTSEALIEPLEAEDFCLQGMADASPPKWHLAHTTWFLETFVLIPHCPGYVGADRRWNYLFNSYYDAVGPRQPRPQRGLLSRPPMAEVIAWRHKVNQSLEDLLQHNGDSPWLELVELGLQHEQQHQELMLMDLLDAFSRQPLEPAYNDAAGISAAFARNLLHRLNAELGANFDPQSFQYEARWQADQQRVQMALISSCDQVVKIAGETWTFRCDEPLITEYSLKYSPERAVALAQQAGWRWVRRWHDPEDDLSLHLLEATD